MIMIRSIIMVAAVVLSGISLTGRDKALPEPDKKAGLTVMEALSQRKSVREYSDRALSDNALSNVLWAAMGQNRPDGRLTAPTCRNFQEIRLFVFDRDGVSEYIPATHSLRPIATGDYRRLVAGFQEFVLDAPVSLVMIADMTKFGNIDERAKMMAAVDAGIVSENISIACSGLGLATVPRASMDSAEILKLLGLSDNHIAIMNNPVGYAATETN